MKFLIALIVLFGSPLMAQDRPDGSGPSREPVVSPTPPKKREPRNPLQYKDAWFERDRMPVMFDIGYSFRSNFDSNHWHGPNTMTRLRADDMWGGQKWLQLAFRAKLEWGVIPSLDASRVQGTAGLAFGEDFGSTGALRTGIKPFPHTRKEKISYGGGFAFGVQNSTETRRQGNQTAFVTEFWEFIGYSIAELRLSQTLRFNVQDSSIGLEGEFSAQLHVGRPWWIGAIVIGYTWQQYQRGGGSFVEAGFRLSI
ncbi:MAG: hypothetical protein ACYTDT_08580 [Planctomycetota bacterium]|jgi:hypothetical protein